MKPIILALIAGFALLGIVSLLLRYCPTPKRARMLVVTFSAFLPVLVAAHLATPDDLGFLPRSLVVPVQAIDLAFCVFLFGAGFFGGVLQLYNLTDRGFSVRILIDILEARDGRLTPHQVVTGYAGGRGLSWMYDKRVAGLVKSGLVSLSHDRVRLTPRGLNVARWCSRMKAAFVPSLPESGP